MSKRQDWCTEVSWNVFNPITPIITFTVSLYAMDANVLRDAVLVRLENIRFEAYVHVSALMWKVAFGELRALTNRKAVQQSVFQDSVLSVSKMPCLVLTVSHCTLFFPQACKESTSHSSWP
jgi:hypothetical protein